MFLYILNDLKKRERKSKQSLSLSSLFVDVDIFFTDTLSFSNFLFKIDTKDSYSYVLCLIQGKVRMLHR